MAGALAYLLGPITGILFLTLEPHNKNREVRFHAWQSIFFWIALVVVYIVEAMLMSIMPTFITILIGFAWLLIGLGSMAVWLFLMIRAYNGQKWVLPIVGPLAEKQA
ncbi:MAG: hypothetical protein HYZ37_16510 [Candidatus Solibacter usitatus]|nr:hypothetical protein [Candidatus Solibacter usitatus]